MGRILAQFASTDHAWPVRLLLNGWGLLLETAPWLLLGLLLGGLVHVVVPTGTIGRWLGRGGWRASASAALVGTPLPLCSCGVLPAALGLRRSGASKGATVSFLIATPENGFDSIALSYALLGPFMMLARPVAALASATGIGWAVDLADRGRRDQPAAPDPAEAGEAAATCCESAPEPQAASCCDTAESAGDCCAASEPPPGRDQPLWRRIVTGCAYGLTEILDDLVGWLLVGILLAAVIATFVSPAALGEWGRGPLAMVVMLAIGIPMYICASASTPVAASLLVAGVSPGAVLVFLLAGPATNVGSFGIVRRELGLKTALIYIVGLALLTIALGVATNFIIDTLAISVVAQVREAGRFVPWWLAVLCVIVLTVASVRPLRRAVRLPRLAKPQPASQPGA